MADVEKIKLNGSSLNIKDVNAVSIESQSLTAQQKAQARENIGAASVDSVPTSLAELSDDSTHRLVTDVEKTTWNSTIPSTAKGASNGVAELDSNGKVPSSQLPSFVDDVIEGYYNTLDDRFYEESTFTTLIEPIAGKSWVDIPANKSYRWTGSVYVRVDEGVQIGETSDTAYAGNKGKANADAISAINEVIPSTATPQNPLATEEDIPTDAVKYTAQTLTDAQKSQARMNIGAVQSDWTQSNSSNADYIKNKPPILAGNGSGGNLVGGTGAAAMNGTRYANSVAYGYITEAAANYAFAFGENAFAGVYNRNTGKHAVAMGKNVRAEKDYEWAIGKFNETNPDTAFAYGDGTGDSTRHNLMELKTDGTLLLNGNAVKTEGGDDNKLRLGQIWGMKFSAGNSANHSPKYGFRDLFETSSASTTLYRITFQANNSSINDDIRVYQFGDFVGFISPSSSSTVLVQPLLGRKVDYPTTGKWIKVENCYHMFRNCTLIDNFDLSMFDTSEVENMNNMFAGCGYASFKSLDLSVIDTSKVKDMAYMFSGCTYLNTLDISSFDMANVTSYDNMFGSSGSNRPPLTTLKCPKINPHDDIPLNRTLYSQDGTAYTTLPVTTGTSIELRQSWT